MVCIKMYFMEEKQTPFKNSVLSRVILSISVSVALFWYSVQIANIYRFALVGAVFEILWLPFILLLIGLPIFSFIFFVKDKFNPKSLYLYSIFLLGATILMMVFKK
jgi:hypothetical protein